MNRYLSKQEKVSMTRVMLLVDLMDLVINQYEKSQGLDAEFMRDLRMCKTWGKKAIKKRYNLLDTDAGEDFVRHVKHMDIIFVPNDAAQKQYDIVKKMSSSICMTGDDFEKLYSGFIPHTCGKCHKKAWKQCLIREVFRKYGVETVDNNAKECPYSYLEAGVNLEEWAKEWADQNGVKYDPENIWESTGRATE